MLEVNLVGVTKENNFLTASTLAFFRRITFLPMNSITRSLNIVAILTKKQRSKKNVFVKMFLTKTFVFDLCFLSRLQLCLSFW